MKPLIILIMIVFLAGCSKKVVPPTGEGLQGTRNTMVSEGQTVFMDHCNRCHPSGMAGLGPSIFNKPLPGFMIKLQVRKGFGAMPSFDKKHISDTDLKKLVAYIKAN